LIDRSIGIDDENLSGVEVLLVFLRRMRTTSNLEEVGLAFDRSPGDVSIIVCFVSSRIVSMYGRLLEADNLSMWCGVLDKYRNAICEYATRRSGFVAPELGHTAAFIDGTIMEVTRPSRPEANLQRYCYRGDLKRHGLLFSAIVSPTDMFMYMSAPYGLANNDQGILNQEDLDVKLNSWGNFTVLGDSAYIKQSVHFRHIPNSNEARIIRLIFH